MLKTNTPVLRADVTKIRTLLIEDDLTSWDDVWKTKAIPWDGGYSRPPLKEVIESGKVNFPRQGRVLVPGCGLGHDAIFFASSLGLDAVGMDISETVIGVANQNLAALEIPPRGDVKFTTGDFFTLELAEDEKVDLIYDSLSFFVAIPPKRRPDWGRQVTNLIKQGGYLITLMFPIDSPGGVGPPWPAQSSNYHELLDENFVKVVDQVSEVASPGRSGRERIAVWKRS